MKTRPTIKDIARELNSHHSTVSRALCNHPDVKRETKKLVQNAAEKLLPQVDILHNHFHLMKYLNQTVDQTRRHEMKHLNDERRTELKNTRYVFLSNPITMSDAYKLKLFDL